MSKHLSDTDKLRNIIDAFAADTLNASEEQILDNVRAREDPDNVIKKTKRIVADAIATHHQEKLRAARQAYEEATQARERSKVPDDPDKRRVLLRRLVQRRADLPDGVTMAFRDGKGMSDTDIESTLQDLAELGLLDDLTDDDTS